MTYHGKLNSKCSKGQGKGWASGFRIAQRLRPVFNTDPFFSFSGGVDMLAS